MVAAMGRLRGSFSRQAGAGCSTSEPPQNPTGARMTSTCPTSQHGRPPCQGHDRAMAPDQAGPGHRLVAEASGADLPDLPTSRRQRDPDDALAAPDAHPAASTRLEEAVGGARPRARSSPLGASPRSRSALRACGEASACRQGSRCLHCGRTSLPSSHVVCEEGRGIPPTCRFLREMAWQGGDGHALIVVGSPFTP
jgi:hypothetical protein